MTAVARSAPPPDLGIPLPPTVNVTRLPGTNIVSSWVFVPPELAAQFWKANTRNRNFMRTAATQYGCDMLDDQWVTTHAGIAFDLNGVLADGQHRLDAIISSGKGQWILVTWGLSEEAIKVIDRGRKRNAAQDLQIDDEPLPAQRLVAVARVMIIGPSHGGGTGPAGVTDTTLRKFIDRHRDALEFSIRHCPRWTAAIGGLIARAHCTADHDRLARFPLAMGDKISVSDLRPGDKTARHFAQVVLPTLPVSGAGRILQYRKGQKALRLYLDGIDSTKIYESDKDLFPLPDGLPSDVEGE